MGSEDLNSDPHVCLTSARPAEQGLQPYFQSLTSFNPGSQDLRALGTIVRFTLLNAKMQN